MQQKHNIKNVQKNKLLISALGALLFVLAFLVLISYISEYSNEGQVRISINQTMYFGTDLTNSHSGYWQNEGELYFQRNLVNNGEINCGSCLSGVNYFNDENQQLQVIGGVQPIELYDVILDNPANLRIENELQVKNSLQFLQGDILSNLSNPADYVHFLDDAIYSGANDANHVVGYVGKTGDDNFIFPVGDGTQLYPIEIKGSVISDFFKVGYFPVSSGSTTFSNGSLFDASAKEATIHSVHNREFWDIDGSTATAIKFEWKADNDLNTLLTDLIDLVIAGWDGSQWVSLGQNALTGSINTGSIQTDPIIPSNYLAFTFARVNAGTFPVEWLSFQVEKTDQDAKLLWKTAQEIGTDKYEIERSRMSGSGFSKIGETEAEGDRTEISSYTFVDNGVAELNADRLYYRLKQIDLDGGFSYSKIISFDNARVGPRLSFHVFPNPARDYVIIDMGESSSEVVQLEIINLAGEKILQKEVETKAQQSVSLEGLPAGAYIISVIDEAQMLTKKLVKR